MTTHTDDQIRSAVLDAYRRAARGEPTAAGGCCDTGCGCGGDEQASVIGYSPEELAAVPAGSNLGLGCGHPTKVPGIREGETVLDLGSGSGFDCFLAAAGVGQGGQVIGVDMTPEMVARARDRASDAGITNVSFRLGEIEHLPVADGTVDVIISNCVVNLAPDKRAVYREAFRVLKPGGRLAISDVVAHAPLPEEVRDDLRLWASCAAGASAVDELSAMLLEIGFEEVRIDIDTASGELIRSWSPVAGLERSLSSAMVLAVKRSAT